MKKKSLKAAAKAELAKSLDRYQDQLTDQLVAAAHAQNSMPETAIHKPAGRVNYRKLAFAHYAQFGQIVCAHCGFGITAVLEVAHVDRNRANNDKSNWAILCPTCHRMYDLNLITTETIIQMRDRPKIVSWATLMKDAGAKAAKTRTERAKWKKAGLKAAETRKRNAERNKEH